MPSYAFHALIFVNPMLSMLSMVFHGFIFQAFHAFMGNTVTMFLSDAGMESMELTHKNHRILLWLHAPWFSSESMELPHAFEMVFPWFFHAFSDRV